MIHVVNKGKEGEREVVRILNAELTRVCEQLNLPTAEREIVMQLAQRNQNQSAVGGGDIDLLGISFEVKRQETISVGKWWEQCCKSARRNGDIPVLIYRQNRKAWHVVMNGFLPVGVGTSPMGARVTITLDTFLSWFCNYATRQITNGNYTRV